MNPTVMHGLALGLLVSFGMVVGIAIVFATLYRRHLRLLRRSQRWMDPLGPLVAAARVPGEARDKLFQRVIGSPEPTNWKTLAVRPNVHA